MLTQLKDFYFLHCFHAHPSPRDGIEAILRASWAIQKVVTENDTQDDDLQPDSPGQRGLHPVPES